jgi:RNA polymerase sigma factor (sigma-70 family)
MQTNRTNRNVVKRAGLKFEDLVEKYYQPLYQFAYSLTRSEADAWDLTQQTFYVWRTKGEQLKDVTKVKAWLFTTLHRAFLQSRRRTVRFPHFELDQVDAELPCVSPYETSQMDSARVLQELANVDHVFRAPLALFYLDDCPYKDIASILKVPLGTVKSRISRGIAQLQKLLEPVEECRERVAA